MDGASEGQATDGRSGRGLRQKGRRAETSFSAVAASRTTESWDGCCRASAGRDRSSRLIRLERFSPLARNVDFERYDFRVGGLSGCTVEIVSVQIGLARPEK